MSNISDLFPRLAGTDSDPRVRRYLTPSRVLTTGGNVTNAQALLAPKPSQITLVRGEVCALENAPGSEKAFVLLDFGIELNGAARIYVQSVRSESKRVNLRVRFGESAMEAMTPIGEKNTTNDHANRDMVLNVGFLSANETNETGFRFVYIELLDEDAKIELKAVQGVFIFRDLDYLGSFECDDPVVNQIWKAAAYTAHLNMQEYLWDGIKRDRLVWIGDMHTEVMTILSVFGANPVIPKSLDLVRDETPVGSWMNGISSYSIWWILLHDEWFSYTGDLDYLNAQKYYLIPLLQKLAEYIDENGSETLPNARFIDWPNQANSGATHAGLQAMMLLAFEKGGTLCGLLGDQETAELCDTCAAKLKKHIPDPCGSKQAGSLLVCVGLADAKETAQNLLTVGGAKGLSTFLGYWTLAAMSAAGDTDGALDLMREYWGGMLKMGATTFWEDFNIDWMENSAGIDELVPAGKNDIHGDFGAYCYKNFRHSLCHGWASGPAPWLTHHVLGIQILEPGCKKLKIEPHLGHLKFAHGTFPTPCGMVLVEVKNENGKLTTDVKAPEGVEVTTM
ncbi:MAG TPA: alpha-L-rhamnosidase C-terminal domain-containing protein [Oscillospiraceae bacterium]|nr:alpha-L-rhamnosidase C-terminal domain-containing protein [Oscillospiraceae bacterium]HPK36541.1 alpha-L-rhamnosidase C-terminal domain-containing protein [Oscillospiraceae bacterium]HPR75518.1 alpha-L-rhamnosidase C-terminal domain-containing protein [Oscillospiraceae bacterium]